MQVHFYAGWPLRYAHIKVEGIRTVHDAEGTICLWAEDDPAQINGRDLQVLWNRLDEWAGAAQHGFGPEDRALDAYRLFADRNTTYRAELPLGELIARGSNGYSGHVFATMQGNTVLIQHGNPPDPRTIGRAVLNGVFYLRAEIDAPPRTLAEVESALARRQRRNLKRGLGARSDTVSTEPSGGYDFMVLAWPRHDSEHDAIVLSFSSSNDNLRASALSATSNDIEARRRRAGPDTDLLATKKVLLAGAGSVGGHVAVALASSGVGSLQLADSDYLTTANLVRHVAAPYAVGYKKTHAVDAAIEGHAPWTTVTHRDELPYDPPALLAAIEGFDLVIDCTGVLPLTAALAETCRRMNIPLIAGALFHHGALARVQRQANGDTLIAARPSNPNYLPLPPDDTEPIGQGFLELGCTAPINNAPPIAVVSTAAEIAGAVTDLMTGRRERPDERIVVFRTMNPPFDRTGVYDAVVPPPQPKTQ